MVPSSHNTTVLGEAVRGVAVIVSFTLATTVPLIALHAEPLTLCGQKIDYQRAASDTASTKGRELVGVWVGELVALNVAYSVDYRRCTAFAIDSVTVEGKVIAKYVAGDGAKNMQTGTTFSVKPVATSWNGELSGDGKTLRFVGDGSVYEFPLSGSASIEGKFRHTSGYGRVFLKKQ